MSTNEDDIQEFIDAEEVKLENLISGLDPKQVKKYYPKIKEIEFTSTFRFAVAITLVPFYVLILTWILFLIVGITLALWYFIAVLVLALSAVKL